MTIMRVERSKITGATSLSKRAGKLSIPVGLFVSSFLNKLIVKTLGLTRLSSKVSFTFVKEAYYSILQR